METRLNIEELIGRKYNKLIILKFSHFRTYKKSRAPIFECLCDCGKTKEVSLWDLKRGSTKSCGCIKIEKAIKYNLENGFKRIRRMYERAAKLRSYKFELTDDEFKKLIYQNCHYCNCDPNNRSKSFSEHTIITYNGIDRIDNNLGYTIDNCVSCCYMCNRCKTDLSYEEFILWIKKVFNNLNCKSCES